MRLLASAQERQWVSREVQGLPAVITREAGWVGSQAPPNTDVQLEGAQGQRE